MDPNFQCLKAKNLVFAGLVMGLGLSPGGSRQPLTYPRLPKTTKKFPAKRSVPLMKKKIHKAYNKIFFLKQRFKEMQYCFS